MDLALRFIVLRNADARHVGDVHEFLRDQMEVIAADNTFDEESESRRFTSAFEFLDRSTDGNVFRHWSATHRTYRGGFSLASYEGLGLAIGRHWDQLDAVKEKIDVPELVRKLWTTNAYRGSFSGLRARERMARVVSTADELVKDAIVRAGGRITALKKVPSKKAPSVSAKKAPAKKAGATRVAVKKSTSKKVPSRTSSK